jgi:hypothetical protein
VNKQELAEQDEEYVALQRQNLSKILYEYEPQEKKRNLRSSQRQL